MCEHGSNVGCEMCLQEETVKVRERTVRYWEERLEDAKGELYWSVMCQGRVVDGIRQRNRAERNYRFVAVRLAEVGVALQIARGYLQSLLDDDYDRRKYYREVACDEST